MSNGASRVFGRSASCLVILAATLSLGGCMTAMDYEKIATPYAPVTPEERHPIVVSDTRISMEIPVRRRMSRLPADVRADVQRFLAHYSSTGSGQLVVTKPRRARHQTSMAVALSELRGLMIAAGISPSSVSVHDYPKGSAGTTAPLMLSFQTVVAIPPECGDWSQNMAISHNNQTMPNFGCTSQANLAAMVANPNDLVTPRATTPKYSRRPDVVMEQYRVGSKTEADTSAAKDNSVSEVGKQ